MSTAGLSRAYAVLRQLDVLRAEGIRHPLPMPGDLCLRVGSGGQKGGQVAQSSSRSLGESAVREVCVMECQSPPQTGSKASGANQGDVIRRDSMQRSHNIHSSPSTAAMEHRGCSSKPSDTHALIDLSPCPGSTHHHIPQIESPPLLIASEEDRIASAAATTAGAQSRYAAISSADATVCGPDGHTPPRPSSGGSGGSPSRFISASDVSSVHRENRKHAKQGPLLGSMPVAGGAVPAPAVLPPILTGEDARVAKVLMSPAQSNAPAVDSTGRQSSIHTGAACDTQSGTRPGAESMQCSNTVVDASGPPESTTMPSSLRVSPLIALTDGDAPSAGSTPLFTASRGVLAPLGELPLPEEGVVDRNKRRQKYGFPSASSPSTHTTHVYTTPREERLGGASHQSSRHSGLRGHRRPQHEQREASFSMVTKPSCLLSSSSSLCDATRFCTAPCTRVRTDSDPLAYSTVTPQQQPVKEKTFLCTTGRRSLHRAPLLPRDFPDRSGECGMAAACGSAGDDEVVCASHLADSFKERAMSQYIRRETLPSQGIMSPRCAYVSVAEERSDVRADSDDNHPCRYTHKRLQRDSQVRDTPCGDSVDGITLFPPTCTKALPFLDYLARVSSDGSKRWLHELTAMGEAWANTSEMKCIADGGRGCPEEVTESVVVDCLLLDLLLNSSKALERIVVPWLRMRVESMTTMTAYAIPNVNYEAGNHRGQGVAAVATRAVLCSEERGLREGDTTSNDNVLCAIIGLGTAAATLFPALLCLLYQLPFPSPTSVCDVRLVALAIRTVGGSKGLEAMIRIVQLQAEKPHVLAAAAYALSTYSFELVGHTSVVCVPPGELCRRSGTKKGATSLFELVTDDDAVSAAALPRMEELRPLWSDDSFLLLPTAATPTLPGPHFYFQSPPPYRPNHLMMDAECARCELVAYFSSDEFRLTQAHPHTLVLLDDALNARLLSRVVTPKALDHYSPVIYRLREDLHRVLTDDIANTVRQQKCSGRGQRDMRGTVAQPPSLLQLPYLSYSLRFFADDEDTLFALESALVHALLARPGVALVQEQALMSLCTLPPEARVHVVQPVTDFFIGLTRVMHLQQATTMRRSVIQTADTSDHPAMSAGLDIGAGKVESTEAVIVAAAVAAGTVCSNPLVPGTRVDSCIAALVPVFQQLLHSPLWRVRHAACLGLARMGPMTPDPPSIVDFFTSCLAVRTPLATEECRSNPVPSAVAKWSPQVPLQSAIVVWCLAQQRQGGVRALLQLLQDSHQPPQVHCWCAFHLADVDVRGVCAGLGMCESQDGDALLDELVRVLGVLIATQGALDENTVLLCVRALAAVVHRYSGDATSSADTAGAAMNASLLFDTPRSSQDAAAAAHSPKEAPSACFTALSSLLEAALLPINVLKALCLYLCQYGGCHGELYVSNMLLQSRTVAHRTAAAFGLRACGAKVLRSVVLGMNDDSFDVRRESFETLTVIGASAALDVLRQRPPEQRHQVRVALRDCLLRDAGRSVRCQVAETLYQALLSRKSPASQTLSWLPP